MASSDKLFKMTVGKEEDASKFKIDEEEDEEEDEDEEEEKPHAEDTNQLGQSLGKRRARGGRGKGKARARALRYWAAARGLGDFRAFGPDLFSVIFSFLIVKDVAKVQHTSKAMAVSINNTMSGTLFNHFKALRPSIMLPKRHAFIAECLRHCGKTCPSCKKSVAFPPITTAVRYLISCAVAPRINVLQLKSPIIMCIQCAAAAGVSEAVLDGIDVKLVEEIKKKGGPITTAKASAVAGLKKTDTTPKKTGLRRIQDALPSRGIKTWAAYIKSSGGTFSMTSNNKIALA